MGRNKQPIDLLLAKGKSAFSQETIERRRAEELKVPFTDVEPPEYLSSKQKDKFTDIADKLLALNIMTELDVDCLARYVLAHDLYLAYTSQMTKAIKDKDMSLLKEMQNLQDKAFRQAQSAASALGLTITSRGKIVVPQPPEEDEEL